jgi:hypothetical protein
MAWMLEQRLACNNCGTRLEEWDENKGGDRFAYYAKAYACPGCRAIHYKHEAEIENAKKDKNDHPYLPYLKIRLEPQLEIKAEQYRRRFYGGYKAPEEETKRRELSDMSTEGRPTRKKRIPSVAEMLGEDSPNN